jgi:hypothetical protein
MMVVMMTKKNDDKISKAAGVPAAFFVCLEINGHTSVYLLASCVRTCVRPAPTPHTLQPGSGGCHLTDKRRAGASPGISLMRILRVHRDAASLQSRVMVWYKHTHSSTRRDYRMIIGKNSMLSF